MSQNYLASRSSNLSSFNAIAMNYSTLTVSTLSGVSTLNVSRVITTSTIQVNSSMISLGASTNQVYVSSLSYGNFSTATTWVTSMTNLLSTATVAMSANAQYQMTVSPSTTVSSIMYTSTLGSSWTTISAATGLPSATATSYTAGAISGDGQYAALGAYGGYLYRTANSGATWTNTNPNTPAIYLPFETTPVNGSSGGTTLTVTGSPALVTGIVGRNAISLFNIPSTPANQMISGTWSNSGLTGFTVSLWINIQDYSNDESYIFSSYNNYLSIKTITSANQLTATIPIAASPYFVALTIPSPITLLIGEWYNITFIYQSTGTCQFYLNNTLYGTVAGAGVYSSVNTPFILGSNNLNSLSSRCYIDDLKIYNSAITFTPMVPQNWSNIIISNTGQYMLATVANGGLFMSSNFGSTWSQVTQVMLNALWSNLQISATGQYMLMYSTPILIRPNTGGPSIVAVLRNESWRTNGINWTASASSTLPSSTLFPYKAFNNYFFSSSWANSLTNYRNTGNTAVATTTIIGVTQTPSTGDWLQLQSSVPVVLYSYQLGVGGSQPQMPQTFYIAGSNDGINWYPIQYASIAAQPSTDVRTLVPSVILANTSGNQTYGNTTLTATTYPSTTNPYTYFRLIGRSIFNSDAAYLEIGQWLINFQAGGQTYSTNYGATWNNGYALPTPTALSLSGSGQYAIGANNSVPSAPVVYVTNNFLQGFSTGTFTTPNFTTPLLGTGNNPVASAVSNTGQYMVLITNNISGNNVYYSTNFGALFTSLQLGTTLLTSCAISYDGSYITVSNATTTWTLNNNSNGFSLALGNQAGYQNQGQNAIAIGNYAGYQNQTANSIILNASGAAVNSFAPGFYVAPIASYTASSSGSYNLLGYGTDNQVVQTGFILSNNYSKITRTTTQLLQLVGDNISSIYMGLNEIKITGNGASHWSIFGARTDNNHNYFSITNTSNNMSPGTLGTDVLTILDNGNVGIGKTNPAYTLDVNGTINASTFNSVVSVLNAYQFTNQLSISATAPACYLFSLTTTTVTIQSPGDNISNGYAKAIIYLSIGTTGIIASNVLLSLGVQINSYSAGSLSFNVGYGPNGFGGSNVAGGGTVTVSLTRFI